MRLIQLAALLLSVTSIKMTESCEIASNARTAHGRVIDVTCELDMNFCLKMEDGEDLSTLEVFGKAMGEEFKSFLKAERHGESNNASITLLGKRLDDKDENSADESSALEDLMENPYITNFPAVARLIHDELQLPGLESSSMMMLYRIGMSLPNQHSLRTRRSVDWRIYAYHGGGRYLACSHRGWFKWSTRDLNWWTRGGCLGLCGKRCSCWQWVCGDCCLHRGCLQHDYDCQRSYWDYDCWSYSKLRNVQLNC